jgi:predicted RNA-binding Zn-ribbon protein involved in translation (DUF1610 family)
MSEGPDTGRPDAPTGEPPPVETTPAETRTFPCESCGGDLTFHIGAQSLKCPFCGAVKEMIADPGSAVREQDFGAMLERLAELRGEGRHDEQGLREVECDACSGTVRFEGTLTSRQCPYCGSPLQLERAHEANHRVPVDGVVPFQIERKAAATKFRQWVKSRWFAPGEFTKYGAHGKFNGIYLPYWTFDSMTDTSYTGQRGDHYWVTEGSGNKKRRVRKTRWRPASGRFQRFFDDLLVTAGSGLPEARVRALEPWPLERAVPFDRGLLAGFLARTYDVELDQGFDQARRLMEHALRGEVRQRIGGDVQRIHTVSTTHAAVTFKHLLLPLWMLAYRFTGKTYQVVVNAVTGEVQGDRPWSWIKIALAVVAAAIVAGVAIYFVR